MTTKKITIQNPINRQTTPIADLAADYKANNLTSHQAWDQFIIDRILKPEIDAKEFYKVFNIVTPCKLNYTTEIDFTPTHTHKETGILAQITIDQNSNSSFITENGQTGTNHRFHTNRFLESWQPTQETIQKKETLLAKKPWELTKDEYFIKLTADSLPPRVRQNQGWIVIDSNRPLGQNSTNWWDKEANPSKHGITNARPATFGEYSDAIHKENIQLAIKNNKPIPETVINEYPDLFPYRDKITSTIITTINTVLTTDSRILSDGVTKEALIAHIPKRSKIHNPDYTYALQKIGVTTIPGLRLADCEEAGIMALYLDQKIVTPKEYTHYIDTLQKGNHIHKDEQRIIELYAQGKTTPEVAKQLLTENHTQITSLIMNHAPDRPTRTDEARTFAETITRKAKNEIRKDSPTQGISR